MLDWLILLTGGIFETGFAYCLAKARESAPTESYAWYAGFAVCLLLSMLCLIYATKTIPIGTAYAVWTGIGAAGAVLAGIILFKEPAGAVRLFFLTTLILSIIGLKWFSER